MNDEISYGEDINWGKYGKDIVPSPIYQVYRIKGIWSGDDASLWYSFEPGDGIEPSEISIIDAEDPEKTYTKIEANKYGYAEGVVKVQITVSEQLKEAYPAAIVNIDGKEYDLAKLNEPIDFYMNKNHRISIFWNVSELVETFRVVML
jgi:hypothetical protein